MEELDLFRDWTPEMIEGIKSLGKSRGDKISEGLERYYSNPDNKDTQWERNRRRSESIRRTLSSLTSGQMEERMRNSCRSPEGQEKALANNHFKNPEVQEELAEGRRRMHANMTEKEKQEWVNRSLHSEEGKRNQKKFFAEESEEAKWERLNSTFLSSEAKRKSKEGYRRYLESLTSEEKERVFGKRIEQMREARMNMTPEEETRRARKISESLRVYWAGLTPEERENLRRKNSEAQVRLWANMTPEELKARQINLPSVPEVFLGMYLDKNFPGRTGYNGDGRLGIKIGGKIPDFPYLNGEKKVVEVLGGIGYYHFWGDEKMLIEHYKKYGYECIVVWEWDCYLLEELDKIFKVGIDTQEVL